MNTATTTSTMIVAPEDRRRTIGIVAGVALATGIGGLLIGRSMAGDPEPVVAAAAEPAEGVAGAEGGEEEHAEGLVKMTLARIATAGIQTEVVATGTLGTEILAQATVSAPPEGRAALTARADGR